MAGPEFVKSARHPVLDAGYRVRGRRRVARGRLRGVRTRRRRHEGEAQAAPDATRARRREAGPPSRCAALHRARIDAPPSSLQLLMRRNSVYVAFILGGAMVGERVSGEEGVVVGGGRRGRPAALRPPLLFPPSSILGRRLRHQHPVEVGQQGQAVRRLPGGGQHRARHRWRRRVRKKDGEENGGPPPSVSPTATVSFSLGKRGRNRMVSHARRRRGVERHAVGREARLAQHGLGLRLVRRVQHPLHELDRLRGEGGVGCGADSASLRAAPSLLPSRTGAPASPGAWQSSSTSRSLSK